MSTPATGGGAEAHVESSERRERGAARQAAPDAGRPPVLAATGGTDAPGSSWGGGQGVPPGDAGAAGEKKGRDTGDSSPDSGGHDSGLARPSGLGGGEADAGAQGASSGDGAGTFEQLTQSTRHEAKVTGATARQADAAAPFEQLTAALRHTERGRGTDTGSADGADGFERLTTMLRRESGGHKPPSSEHDPARPAATLGSTRRPPAADNSTGRDKGRSGTASSHEGTHTSGEYVAPHPARHADGPSSALAGHPAAHADHPEQPPARHSHRPGRVHHPELSESGIDADLTLSPSEHAGERTTSADSRKRVSEASTGTTGSGPDRDAESRPQRRESDRRDAARDASLPSVLPGADRHDLGDEQDASNPFDRLVRTGRPPDTREVDALVDITVRAADTTAHMFGRALPGADAPGASDRPELHYPRDALPDDRVPRDTPPDAGDRPNLDHPGNHDDEAGGALRLKYPDGAVQEKDSHGTNTFTSPDGSMVRSLPDGTIVASPDLKLGPAPGGLIQGTTRDGYTVTANGRGDMWVRSRDGSTTGVGHDGTVSVGHDSWSVVTSPEGRSTTTLQRPDGSTLARDSDGTTSVRRPDGSQTTLRPDGTIVHTASDGTVTIRGPVGRTAPAADGSPTSSQSNRGDQSERASNKTTAQAAANEVTDSSARAAAPGAVLPAGSYQFAKSVARWLRSEARETFGQELVESMESGFPSPQVQEFIDRYGVDVAQELADGYADFGKLVTHEEQAEGLRSAWEVTHGESLASTPQAGAESGNLGLQSRLDHLKGDHAGDFTKNPAEFRSPNYNVDVQAETELGESKLNIVSDAKGLGMTREGATVATEGTEVVEGAGTVIEAGEGLEAADVLLLLLFL